MEKSPWATQTIKKKYLANFDPEYYKKNGYNENNKPLINFATVRLTKKPFLPAIKY